MPRSVWLRSILVLTLLAAGCAEPEAPGIATRDSGGSGQEPWTTDARPVDARIKYDDARPAVDGPAVTVDRPPDIAVIVAGDGPLDVSVDGPEREAGDASEQDRASDASEAARAANGAACAYDDECGSGLCVDNVCCNDRCAGACHSCKIVGSVGTCMAVPAGLDPRNDCSEEPASTCGLDGFCDGKGQCRKHVTGTECAPGGCNGDSAYGPSRCDGHGDCGSGASSSCPGTRCVGDTCGKGCTLTPDCGQGFVCDDGTCEPLRPLGAPCGSSFRCASGACVDGVCCDNACDDACESCSVPGSVGTCAPAPSGTVDPACAAEPATSCGLNGQCDGKGACQRHPEGTECSPVRCTGTTLFSARTCDGAGTCRDAQSTACPSTECVGNACGAACGPGMACEPGHYCDNGTCKVKLVKGHACDDPAQCATGFCADGVCCDGACSGDCRS